MRKAYTMERAKNAMIRPRASKIHVLRTLALLQYREKKLTMILSKILNPRTNLPTQLYVRMYV